MAGIGGYLKKHTEALVKDVGVEAACDLAGKSKATMGRYYSDAEEHADRFMPIDTVATRPSLPPSTNSSEMRAPRLSSGASPMSAMRRAWWNSCTICWGREPSTKRRQTPADRERVRAWLKANDLT